MTHLEDVPLEDLQRALDEVEDPKAIQRLTAALAYKNGVSQTEIAEWYDVQRRTVYSWLTRLDEEPIAQAVTDDDRSGRPRKLTDEQLARLEETLHEPPTGAGYDAPAWTPALVQAYLAETFDVAYSTPSCRRLMKEAGLVYRKPHPNAPEPPSREADEHDDERDRRAGRWVPE